MEKPTEKPNESKVPPPPSETEQKDLPPIDKSLKESPSVAKPPEHTMTLSTKLSTDQLICKTPQDSTNGSVTALKQAKILTPNRIVMGLGVLQFLFGFLMVLFGVYVIAYKASLSHVSSLIIK